VNYRGAPVFVTILVCSVGCTGNPAHQTPPRDAFAHESAYSTETVQSAVIATIKPKETRTLATVYSAETAPTVSHSGHFSRLDPVTFFESILDKIAQIRSKYVGLHPEVRRTNQAEMDEWLRQELAYQKAEVQSQPLDAVLIAWNLLPAGFNSQQAVLNQLIHKPHSMYLSSRRQIAVPLELPPEMLQSGLLHEVVHAYQDEHHHLGQKLVYELGHGDRISALHAFAEGEALLVDLLTQVADDEDRLPTVDELRPRFTRALEGTGLPSILARSLAAPYLDGYRFVVYLHKLGGFSLVDRVWSRGLACTQELLHPERWVSQCNESVCPPLLPLARMSSPLPLSMSSTQSYQDSFGEQGLRLILEHTLSENDASRLSADLLNDKLTVFQHGATHEILWQLRLLSPHGARLVCSALKSTLSSNPPAGTLPDCVGNDRAVLAFRCAERDIWVSSSIQTDTWTAKDSTSTCGSLRAWMASRDPMNSVTYCN
jgi:hypothetical protein